MSSDKKETFRELIRKEGMAPKRSPNASLARSAPENKPDTAPNPRPKTKVPKIQSGQDGEEWRVSGMSLKEMIRLRQGKITCQRKCDFHGDTVKEAIQKLTQFILQCQIDNINALLLICGYGKHSKEGQPILKPSIRDHLIEAPEVLALCPAQDRDGGKGAYYVLLRK